MKKKNFGLLSILDLLVITALGLAACAQATPTLPANKVLEPTQTPASTKAPVPTATAAPTATTMPTTAATAVPTSTIPTIEPNSLTTNDATQARLRVNQCVPNEPDMDVYMNGKVPVTAGVPLSLPAGDVSRYEYLPPGTVRVAVVPSGMGINQALLAPQDLSLEAGHRYTLVVLGQPEEPTHKSLLIDETKAYQQAGSNSNTSSHISVNNVKGAVTLSFLQDGMGEKDVPYGGFAASVLPERFKEFTLEINGKTVENNGSGTSWVAADTFDCFFGSVSSETSHTGAFTSGLNAIDYLQEIGAENARVGGVPSFATFLAAVKNAGLTELLSTGGPYLVFAPTDAAFAALPKDQLDALMSDPNVLRAYIVEGYYPTGTLGHGTFDRTVTNLLGEPLVLLDIDDDFGINGVKLGLIDFAMTANGTRVLMIKRLMTPAVPTASEVVLGTVSGRIAFQTNRDGNLQIYIMNGDGSGLTNLTGNLGGGAQPVWSPDGSKILFVTDVDGNDEIYVMNADGSDPTNLTNNPAQDDTADWSPDGKKIVFMTDRDGNHEIYMMNADGSDQTNLTDNPAADDSFPVWSRDGKQIGFTSDRDNGDPEIYVMNADGSNPIRLTHDAAEDTFPHWSPDGKKIVYTSGLAGGMWDNILGNGSYEIYVMNADGSNRIQLTNSPGGMDDNMDPRWSPDGTQILFWSSRDGNKELYVMDADGSNQTRLTNTTPNNSSWSSWH
jgi:Tol biopolymer transport system component